MTATIDPSAAQPRLDLDAIEARANAATPGPWQVEDGDGETDVPVGTSDGYLCCSPDDGVRGGHARADAEFIVHAHADIPALLAEVRRLRGGDGFRRESAILRWAADRAEASKVLSREAVVAQLRRWADELDAAPAAHKPFVDDGVTYCGWDRHEGCGEVWPCSTVRARTTQEPDSGGSR